MRWKSVCFLVLSVAGCATYTEGVRPTETPGPDGAYVFGSFSVKADTSVIGNYPTMGLVLTCSDGETYTIGFSIENPVQVLKIRPARCTLTEIVGTDAGDKVRLRRRPPPSWVHADSFEAGKMYYLGDFLGRATWEHDWKVIYTEHHWTWDFNPLHDRMNVTTAEMKATFPSLASLPVVDQRLAPVPPPPPPGAVGPPISPARAARIAPFTKRRYPTPMECQADCKVGQCLPFRDETGHAAVTCIVRCKSDSDCPAGLACNCAEGADTTCHHVAQLPDDPMENLCLSPETRAGAN